MDAKLRKLILKFGAEGYGVYWFCIESIAQQVEPHNLTFELEHDSEIIGHSLGLSDKKVEAIMRYMLELDLFQSSNGVITCLKLAKRADEYTQKLLRCPDIIPTLSGQNPTKSALLDKNRLDEINKKRVDKKRSIYKHPTEEEVKTFFLANNSTDFEATRYFDYYTSNGWRVGRNSMKDWRAAARNWIRKNNVSSNGRPMTRAQAHNVELMNKWMAKDDE